MLSFSHKMSCMRSGTYLSQFLRVCHILLFIADLNTVLVIPPRNACNTHVIVLQEKKTLIH